VLLASLKDGRLWLKYDCLPPPGQDKQAHSVNQKTLQPPVEKKRPNKEQQQGLYQQPRKQYERLITRRLDSNILL
jgi:hypothetical protein